MELASRWIKDPSYRMVSLDWGSLDFENLHDRLLLQVNVRETALSLSVRKDLYTERILQRRPLFGEIPGKGFVFSNRCIVHGGPFVHFVGVPSISQKLANLSRSRK